MIAVQVQLWRTNRRGKPTAAVSIIAGATAGAIEISKLIDSRKGEVVPPNDW